MPCNDISERILVDLDLNDRVINYSLTKETCGAEVGSPSLLHAMVAEKDLQAILDLDSFSLGAQWRDLPERQGSYPPARTRGTRGDPYHVAQREPRGTSCCRLPEADEGRGRTCPSRIGR